MKYFFVLGKNFSLSIAELSAVFGFEHDNKDSGFKPEFLSEQVLIIDLPKEINPNEIIKRLGGTIKIGIIDDMVTTVKQEELLKKTKKMLNPPEDGKYKYGISYYGKNKFNQKPLAMEIKKYLREQKISCRWVTSREKTLSSVVVEQNKLTNNGVEVVLINVLDEDEDFYEGEIRESHLHKNSCIYLGHTLAVQPFKELSYRDYGRPARDEQSGMLPPKLAQIMINLARADKNAAILDPFCGSGTILTEAMLMGYKHIIGSDISKKAIEDTRKNLQWISKKFQIPNSKFQITKSDIVELDKNIKPNSINAIITEPYLGPQRGHIDVKETTKELEKLYSQALAGFNKVLKPGGRIVMLWPVFKVVRNAPRLSPELHGFKIVNPIPENLHSNKNIKLSGRNTIIYGRPGQRVWREIVILEKT